MKTLRIESDTIDQKILENIAYEISENYPGYAVELNGKPYVYKESESYGKFLKSLMKCNEIQDN